MSLSPADVAKRAVVFALAVGVVVGGAAAGATVLAPTPGAQNVTVPSYSAFDARKLAPDTVDDTGSIDSLEGLNMGVVLIDRGDRTERGDITGLERAITQAGGSIRYLRDANGRATVSDESFNESLADADSFVVVDPGKEYDGDKLRALRDFVDSGGRLVIAGEPTYNEVQVSGLQARLVNQKNRLVAVGSQFGLAFGTEYLVNMRDGGQDGLYKNIKLSGGESGYNAGVKTAVFYTATTVYPTGDGTRLLVGQEGTRLASGGGPGNGTVPVASLNAAGTVLGVGDTTFMTEPNHNVADNEVFLVRLAQFLSQGDAEYEPPKDETTTTTTTTSGF